MNLLSISVCIHTCKSDPCGLPLRTALRTLLTLADRSPSDLSQTLDKTQPPTAAHFQVFYNASPVRKPPVCSTAERFTSSTLKGCRVETSNRESDKGTRWSRLFSTKSLESRATPVNILGLTSFFSYSINCRVVCLSVLCSLRRFTGRETRDIFRYVVDDRKIFGRTRRGCCSWRRALFCPWLLLRFIDRK
jgi:hypothetical protein